MKRITRYFFLIAAIISILAGVFSTQTDMNTLKIILLLFCGIGVGVSLHNNEKDFLIAGGATLIAGYVSTVFLFNLVVLDSIVAMLTNFIIFLSMAVMVVGVKVVSQIATAQTVEETDTKELNKLEKIGKKEIEQLTFEYMWGIIILVAVGITFFMLLAEMFYDVTAFSDLFLVLDIFVTILFIADLFILYNDSKGWKDFVTHNFFDIIASIPTVGVLRGLKIIRAVRVIKVMKSSAKFTKVIRLYRTTKFFSKRSYFTQLEKKK